VAKKRNRKRGWSGAPATRPAGATRPGGSTRPAGGTTATRPGPASEDDGDVAAAAPETPAASSTARPARTQTAAPSQQTLSNRAARKEEARKQRELIRRREARRRTMRRWGIIAGVVVAVGAVATLIVLNSGGGKDLNGVNPRDLPGIITDPAPWPPQNDTLADRLDAMGLPPLGGEAQAYHIHQNLVVYIDGVAQQVPYGIGLITSSSLAEIHTHSNSGTIHVEAGANRHFTLQTVFDIWGVLFTKDQLGSYKNTADKKIRIFVDGKQVSGDPAKVPLADQVVIVVTYGTAAEVPSPMPSNYLYEKPPTTGPATPGTTGATSAPGTSGQPTPAAS
jgi:hypothetical protein